jgi:hypothetical protein
MQVTISDKARTHLVAKGGAVALDLVMAIG